MRFIVNCLEVWTHLPFLLTFLHKQSAFLASKCLSCSSASSDIDLQKIGPHCLQFPCKLFSDLLCNCGAGGEKSYTTVAFALALGEWTQSPFRAMDEFDVFMDAINRRVAMENLFSNSLEHPDLQFIFLTPQVSRQSQDHNISCLGGIWLSEKGDGWRQRWNRGDEGLKG